MSRLIALLDKPSRDSFGMVPVVVSDQDGRLDVLGLAADSRHRKAAFTRAAYDSLIAGGHALPVSTTRTVEPQMTTVALWLGDDYEAEARANGLELPPLPLVPTPAEGGRFFLGTANDLFVYLEHTVRRAFVLAQRVDASRATLVDLMQRTLPQHQLTLAAALVNARDVDVEYSWQRALGIDQPLESALTAARSSWETYQYSFGSTTFVVFIGESGTNRDLAAETHAKNLHASFRSFSTRLKSQVDAALPPAEIKRAMQILGQQSVEVSPLAFTLSALETDDIRGERVVVDSVRHRQILRVLQWLADGRVKSVGVDGDATVQAERLESRHLNVDAVRSDPTEVEIPDMLKEVNQRINGQGNLEDELRRVG
jgi:hypothetical protein